MLFNPTGGPDQSLEDENRNSFNPNIQYRNPLDFKLPTLEEYDVRNDPIIHIMRHIQSMRVLGATKKLISHCLPLFMIILMSCGSANLVRDTLSHGQVN